MKILLVGAACQGKVRHAANRYGVTEPVHCGERADPDIWEAPGLDKLHLLVLRLLREGKEPVPAILERLDAREDWLVLCDEIGGGIVPVDPLERCWREETGRLCCALAQRADIMERITCGIPLRIKGEGL